jgi:hypothetical protein
MARFFNACLTVAAWRGARRGCGATTPGQAATIINRH